MSHTIWQAIAVGVIVHTIINSNLMWKQTLKYLFYGHSSSNCTVNSYFKLLSKESADTCEMSATAPEVESWTHPLYSSVHWSVNYSMGRFINVDGASSHGLGRSVWGFIRSTNFASETLRFLPHYRLHCAIMCHQCAMRSTEHLHVTFYFTSVDSSGNLRGFGPLGLPGKNNWWLNRVR